MARGEYAKDEVSPSRRQHCVARRPGKQNVGGGEGSDVEAEGDQEGEQDLDVDMDVDAPEPKHTTPQRQKQYLVRVRPFGSAHSVVRRRQRRTKTCGHRFHPVSSPRISGMASTSHALRRRLTCRGAQRARYWSASLQENRARDPRPR
jgi:hypothetical protein